MIKNKQFSRCMTPLTTSSRAPTLRMPVMRKTMLSLIGVACWVSTPSMVSAQEGFSTLSPADSTRRALDDPPGVERDVLNGFFPSIDLIFTDTNNARRDETDESDTFYSVIPRLIYKSEFGRSNEFQAGYTVRFERFSDTDDEDTTSSQANLGVLLDVSRIVDVDVFANRTDAEETRGSSGTRVVTNGEEDEFDATTLGARVTVGRRTNPLQIALGADQTAFNFTNNEQDSRDRDSTGINGSVFYNFSPQTAIFLNSSNRDIDYDSDALGRDSDETSLSVGVRWEPTYITTLNVSAGNLDKDFDDPAAEDFDGSTYLGSINWSPRDATSIRGYASRRTEESPELSSNFFTSDLIGIGISQDIARRFTLTAYVNNIDDEFDDGRTDDISDYGIGVSYGFNRWLSFGLRFSSVERDSNDPDASYEEDLFSLSVRGSWEPAN